MDDGGGQLTLGLQVLGNAVRHLEADYEREREAMTRTEAIVNIGTRARLLEIMESMRNEILLH